MVGIGPDLQDPKMRFKLLSLLVLSFALGFSVAGFIISPT